MSPQGHRPESVLTPASSVFHAGDLRLHCRLLCDPSAADLPFCPRIDQLKREATDQLDDGLVDLEPGDITSDA